MSDLRTVRAWWLAERDAYERLLKSVKTRIETGLRLSGTFAILHVRTKDVSSLLKKTLRKKCSYESVADKAGCRITVRFQHEVDRILNLIENSFVIMKKEDKAEALGDDRVGYSGIHYDVRLKDPSQEERAAGLTELQCEIQVHTLCQSIWSDMNHGLGYKPSQPIPDTLRRQIYLLNALLEVADRNFNSISLEIGKLPGADIMRLLQSLERQFYRFTGSTFDPELSRQVLEHVLQSYADDERSRVSAIIDSFVETHAARLQFVFDQYSQVEDPPVFLFQPESLVLLERVERNPEVLEELWSAQYPEYELERLAVAWGKPLH